MKIMCLSVKKADFHSKFSALWLRLSLSQQPNTHVKESTNILCEYIHTNTITDTGELSQPLLLYCKVQVDKSFLCTKYSLGIA